MKNKHSFLFAEVALIVDWLYTREEESLCLTDSNVVDILTTAHYLGLVHSTFTGCLQGSILGMRWFAYIYVNLKAKLLFKEVLLRKIDIKTVTAIDLYKSLEQI